MGVYVVENDEQEKLITELQFVGLMLMMSVSVASKIGDILLRAQDFKGALVFYEVNSQILDSIAYIYIYLTLIFFIVDCQDTFGLERRSKRRLE